MYRTNSNKVSTHSVIKAKELDAKKVALLGYGVTGRSCAKYLLHQGCELSIFDAQTLKEDQSISATFKTPPIYSLNENTSLLSFDLIVVSPGINLNKAYLQSAVDAGIQVIGDIELFAQAMDMMSISPKVIAITGSNGKSTVVDILHKALSNCGYRVALGGNFGQPVLDMLSDNYARLDYDYIVLELSSFQLESTYSLRPDIACVLNVTSDHMDRHGNMHAYALAKQRVYMHAEYCIFNRDDELTIPPGHVIDHVAAHVPEKGTGNSTTQNQPFSIRSFGLSQAKNAFDFHQSQAGIFQGDKLILKSAYIKNKSQHQLLNMQVVLACCECLGLQNDKKSNDRVIDSLKNYTGLPHRFETIYQDQHVSWINDSKATNAGAAVAAIKCVAEQKAKIVLIAGGDAKGASISEFEALKSLISKHVEVLVLIGRDADLLTGTSVTTVHASSLSDAVNIAHDYVLQANEKSIVLLSPACASFDMFENYGHRGEVFTQSVLEQVAA